MQALPKGGGMVALIAPADTVTGLIETLPPQAGASSAVSGLAIAAYNGPTNTVVSGPQPALERLVAVATAAGIACHPLAVSHAFHSPAMAPMLQDFEQLLRQIRFSPPSRPLVSNVSGELAGPEIAQSDYWCDHVLSPVRFVQGMATLAAQGAVTFVELGAKPTLIGMGRQCLEGSAASGTVSSSSPLAWWPSLRPGFDDWQVMLRSLAELHRSGYPIDWQGFHRPFPHRLVALPGYPFQRQRYWWSRPGQGEAAASLWLGHILGEGPGSGVAAASLSPSPDSAAFSSASPSALASASASPSATAPANATATASLSWPGLEPLALPGGLERRYRTTLAPSSPADLGDHRIRRQVVFPAAGFVQLALQAAQAQDLPLVLADLQLDQPMRLGVSGLVVAGDLAASTELQLVWGPDGIEFHSQQTCSSPSTSSSTSPSSWRAHGRCLPGPMPISARAHHGTPASPHHGTSASRHADADVPRSAGTQKQSPASPPAPNALSTDGLPQQGLLADGLPFEPLPEPQPGSKSESKFQAEGGSEPLDLAAFYGALEAFGLSYGPAFRSLVALSRDGDRAWATLQRQQQAQDWALLDGCFQAVAATLDPEAAAGQLFLPVGLEALQLAALPLPDRLTCQVQLRPSDEPAYVLADLLLLPADPQTAPQSAAQSGSQSAPQTAPVAEPLGWIRGFRLRRLPRAALDWLFPLEAGEGAGDAASAEPGPADWLVRAEWEPLPPSSPAQIPAVPAATAPEGLIRASSLGDDPLAATRALLQMAQGGLTDSPGQASAPLWLLLDTPENPALTGALDGFAKAAALEQSQRQWLRIHLLPGSEPDPVTTAELVASLPWDQIAALAPTELALAWDGRQLWCQRLRPLLPERFRFVTRSFGLLESLEPQAIAAPASSTVAASTPGPGEIELAVEATGLNFRDVLNALGLLRAYSRQLGLDEAAQVPFGGECVGTVTAVGPGVDPSLLGSRLLAALAVGSLASHVTTRAELCVPLPASLTPAQGASVSTAFLTAIYGLQTLAALKPGDTVLIHAAAGGVGQAALQVARRAGARILATASASKQQGLLAQGVEAVFDSRSLAFAEQVRAHTGGRGVDVVLNSLKGDWVDASFEALAEGGRFVELGKIDIWSRSQAALRRPDATYLPFDLLEVAAAEPQLIRGLLEQLVADLEAGRYQLLPIQQFPLSQTAEAFRLMAQARHIGKVVLTNPDAIAAASSGISSEATYLITGALGGLGLQLSQWLADQGATSLLLLARSAANPSAEAQGVLAELAGRGVACTLIACDLAATGAAAAAAEQTLAAALEAVEPGKPLRGVFHAAGVLDDGLIDTQTPDRLAAVLAPKLGGWHLLERALTNALAKATTSMVTHTRADSGPFVVHFSSMASLLGSPGQSNYCAANGALDALATAATPSSAVSTPVVGTQLWCPCLAVQWGPWDGAGMAGALGDRDRQRLQALGVHLLPPECALDALGQLLRRGAAGAVGVLDVDWPRLAAQASPRQAALLEPLVARANARAAAGYGSVSGSGGSASGAGGAGAGAEPPAYLKVLADTPPLERQAVLVGFVQQQLAKVMGLGDPQQIDPGEPLFNMGLDSLMALELTVLLEKNLGVRLTESLVFEHPTVDDLVRYFLRDVLFPEAEPEGHTTSGASDAQKQPDFAMQPKSLPQDPLPVDPNLTPDAKSAPTADSWDQQVADVAAMDTADLLRQLRGE